MAARRPQAPPRSQAAAPYNYFLRGLLHCPHCGCLYTSWPAKGGAVAYYGCLHSQKGRTQCPVGRINADALHSSLLSEIGYAARHHTVLHRLIAELGGWQKADDVLHRLRADVSHKKQFLGVQIANLGNAIANGRTSYRSLLATLERKEREEQEIAEELARLDGEIKENTLARSEAKDVQAYWSEFMELWPYLSHAEQVEVIGHVVKRVVAHEKGRVLLELNPMGWEHGLATERKFLTNKNWEPLVKLSQ